MTSDNPRSPGGEPTAESQVAKVFEWRRGFNAMHLIDIGVLLGLFKAFASTPGATPGQVAAALGLHAPYVETWCTTAYSFGLLEGEEDRTFRLAPFIDKVWRTPDIRAISAAMWAWGPNLPQRITATASMPSGPGPRCLSRGAAKLSPKP